MTFTYLAGHVRSVLLTNFPFHIAILDFTEVVLEFADEPELDGDARIGGGAILELVSQC